jgi:sRNA-binding protein
MRTPHFKETITILAEPYPKTFFEDGKRRRPLKINIVSDIERQNRPELIDSNVGGAVDYYTHEWGYLGNITAGSPRLDLDGNSR